MKVYRSTRQFMKLTGFIPFDIPRGREISQIYIILIALFQFTSMVGIVCGIFDPNPELQLTDRLFELGVLMDSLISYSPSIIMLMQKSKVIELLDKMEQIEIDRIKLSGAFKGIYDSKDRAVAKTIDFFLLITITMTTFTYVYTFYAAARIIMAGDNDSLELYFPMMLPYNWRTPVAYFLTISIQFVILAYLWIYFLSAWFLLVEISRFLIAFTLDVQFNLKELNNNLIGAEIPFEPAIRLQLKIKLNGIIKFYAETMSLAHEASDIFYFCMSVLVTLAAIEGSAFLYITNVMVETGHVDEVSLPLYLLGTISTCVFFVCFFGQKVTTAFEQIEWSIFEVNHYLMPLGMLKKMPILFLGAQQPIYFEGFASIKLTYVFFQNWANAAFSYFLFLRSFEQ